MSDAVFSKNICEYLKPRWIFFQNFFFVGKPMDSQFFWEGSETTGMINLVVMPIWKKGRKKHPHLIFFGKIFLKFFIFIFKLKAPPVPKFTKKKFLIFLWKKNFFLKNHFFLNFFFSIFLFAYVSVFYLFLFLNKRTPQCLNLWAKKN